MFARSTAARRTRNKSRLGALSWVGALACACANPQSIGGQTGDEADSEPVDVPGVVPEGGESAGPGEESSDGDCDETRTPIDGDAGVAALGLNPDAVLALVAEPFESTLRWAETSSVSYLPGPGETKLTLSFETAGAEVSYVESTQRPNTSGREETQEECLNRLEIDAVLEMSTEDGALDERLDVTIEAASERLATVSTRFDFDTLEGAFRIIDVRAPEGVDAHSARLTQPSFEMTFTELGSSGDLRTGLVAEIGSGATVAVTGGPMQLARWPADMQCDGALPGPSDLVLDGPSAQQLADAVSAHSSQAIEWTDGTSTELSWPLTIETDFACFRFGDHEGDRLASTFDARVELASDDGVVSASVPAMVSREPASSREDAMEVEVRANIDDMTSADVAALFPEANVDTTSYDGFFAAFDAHYELSWTPDSDLELTLTRVRVGLTGWSDPMCPPPPSSCSGADRVQLLEGAYDSESN